MQMCILLIELEIVFCFVAEKRSAQPIDSR